MAVNLHHVQKELTKYLHKELGLTDFKIEEKDGNSVTAKNDLTINGYDGDIFVSIIVFKSGSFGVDFVFEKMDITSNALALIHEFNKESIWLSAYIREDGYFVLRYNVMELAEAQVVGNVSNIFEQLLSDDIKELLAPILELMYSD